MVVLHHISKMFFTFDYGFRGAQSRQSTSNSFCSLLYEPMIDSQHIVGEII